MLWGFVVQGLLRSAARHGGGRPFTELHKAGPTPHLSASSRMMILWRPGRRVTFFCANILILLRTTSMPLQTRGGRPDARQLWSARRLKDIHHTGAPLQCCKDMAVELVRRNPRCCWSCMALPDLSSEAVSSNSSCARHSSAQEGCICRCRSADAAAEPVRRNAPHGSPSPAEPPRTCHPRHSALALHPCRRRPAVGEPGKGC